MGIYLALYVVSLLLALVLYSISKKHGREKYANYATFFMVLMIFFLLFALFTDDPIEELLSTIPAFWQFLLTSLAGAFTIWRVYLNPLKSKVYEMDREIGEVKSDVSSIKSDVGMIKENILNAGER